MTAGIFEGVRKQWLPLYEQLKEQVAARVGAFEEHATANAVVWKHTSAFAELRPKKTGLVVAFASDTLHDEWEPAKVVQLSKNRVAHYFELTGDDSLTELAGRIEAAYHLTKAERPRRRGPVTEYATVEQYIAAFPPEVQEILQTTRSVIRGAAPQATEKISWQMPTYHLGENLVHFAAQKHHLGFYPSPEGIETFAQALAGYKTTKGCVQFPYSQPIPYDLIEQITRFRVQQVLAKHG